MSEDPLTYNAAAPGDVMASTANPNQQIEYAVRCANALAAIMAKKPKKVIINKKRYLEIDDWTLLAHFYGLSPATEWTRPVTVGSAVGWEARAKVIHRQSGAEIATAESMCLNDEERWSVRPKYENGKRNGTEPVPSFQLRSMAQTRAQSKALATALRWVAQLGGFAITPAEEMDGHAPEEEQAARPQAATERPAAGDVAPLIPQQGFAVYAVQRVKILSSGTSDKGPWKLHLIDTDRGSFKTFDQGIADLAKEAIARSFQVEIAAAAPQEGKAPEIIEMRRVVQSNE